MELGFEWRGEGGEIGKQETWETRMLGWPLYHLQTDRFPVVQWLAIGHWDDCLACGSIQTHMPAAGPLQTSFLGTLLQEVFEILPVDRITGMVVRCKCDAKKCENAKKKLLQ